MALKDFFIRQKKEEPERIDGYTAEEDAARRNLSLEEEESRRKVVRKRRERIARESEKIEGKKKPAAEPQTRKTYFKRGISAATSFITSSVKRGRAARSRPARSDRGIPTRVDPNFNDPPEVRVAKRQAAYENKIQAIESRAATRYKNRGLKSGKGYNKCKR